MTELDKWAVTRLNRLIERCEKGYEAYDFSAITHAVNDFCVVELSNFYLDVIKDRLYCDEREGRQRRSAQTALYLILDAMTRIMAPILCFTCDEIWQAMPHRSGDDGRNVLFNEMYQPLTDYASDRMDEWAALLTLRETVNGELEKARAEKRIGKSLEAQVVLESDGPLPFSFSDDELADLFIVSQVRSGRAEGGAATPLAGLRVAVAEAEGEKCPRCWKHSLCPDAEGLCPRCARVVRLLNRTE